MKKVQSKVKNSKNSKNFYSFDNYVPNKNAKPVEYKGTMYLSKAQCMALEGITRKELDAYLKGEVSDPEPEVASVIPEGIISVEDAVHGRVNPTNNLNGFDDDAF